MRFFTTLTPAGRLEYLIVLIAIGAMQYAALRYSLELSIDLETREYNYIHRYVPRTIFILTFTFFFTIINVLRRLKDAQVSGEAAFLLLIPIVNVAFLLSLVLKGPKGTATYVPFGKDPYDPNSWVDNVRPHATSAPTTTFQGKAILLPGEEDPAA